MIKGIYTYFDSKESIEAFKIRALAFNGTNLKDRDELDSIAVHGIAFFNETVPVATGRVVYIDGKYEMSRIAVLPEFQRKNIGDFVVRMLADKVFCSGAKEVYVNSPKDTLEFFTKIGFESSDEEFTENGIVFQPLCLKLEKFRTGCGHKYCPSIN